jgi:hypothetical protein
MSKNSYLLLGNFEDNDNNKKYLGGITDAYETIVDNAIYIEGTLSNHIDKTNCKIKGFLKNDITLDKTVTLMALEFPLKKTATNKAYFLELDLLDIKNPRSDEIEGEYEGFMFTGVKINYMKKEDIDALEIPHDELLAALMEIDFEYKDQKEFSIKLGIEKYEKPKINAA